LLTRKVVLSTLGQLGVLAAMGFSDQEKNVLLLKETGGNVQATCNALLREIV
jgi:hypothetical protein